MNEIVVRRATQNDIAILLEFEQGVIQTERPMDSTLKPDPINYYDISELIRGPNSVVYVIEINGIVSASGYAKMISEKPYRKHTQIGYLGMMYVVPKARGKGLNQRIIDALIEWCKEKNLDEVQLEVYAENPTALRAYEKAGFKSHLLTMRRSII